MPKSKRRFKSAIGDLSQSVKSAGKTAAQGAKATGDVATQTAKSVGKTTSQGANAAGSVISQSAEAARGTVTESAKSAGDVVAKAAKVVGSAVGHGMRMAGDSVGVVRERVPWESVSPKQVRNSLTESIESSKSLGGSAKRNLTTQMGTMLDGLSIKDMSVQAQAFATVWGLLGNSQVSGEINAWLQNLVESSTTNFNITIDTIYRETSISEDYYGQFDIYNEDTLNNVVETQADLGVFMSWSNDLVTYDVVELIGGSIGILAVALNWNNDDVEEFSNIVGGIGLYSAISVNPFMLIVTVVAVARAFHVARKSGDWKEFSDGLAKGGICAGAVLLATSLVSGPTVVILLTGICVGILANQATKRVSFVEIGQFIVIKMSKTPLLVENAITSAKDVLPNST